MAKYAGATAIVLAMLLSCSGAAMADWSADSLGESSGLDRGAALERSSAGMPSESTLRASIERTTQMQQQVANAFEYGSTAGASFGSNGPGVMAVSAGSGDSAGEDMEE